ncbi:MAG: hypothetical protein JW747_00675 [Candidatus Aminicenantes bacterium]|nr:hypothetical protein [Candidatus Aminicenantes bacterium]
MPRRGAATLAVLCLFVIFSSLGLGLVFLTQTSLEIGRAVKTLSVLEILAENGAKQEYEALASLLAGRPFPLPLDEERLEDWRGNPAAHASAILETALGREAASAFEGGWGAHSWSGRSDAVIKGIQDLGPFVRAQCGITILSRGNIEARPAFRSVRLEASLDISAGSVPLSFFPVLLDAGADDGAPVGRPPLPGLTVNPAPGLRHLGRVLEAPAPLIPEWYGPAVEHALDLRLFKPQDLSAARLRQALGLEASPDPVPDGVYLVRSDDGLGGVYVRGDLEELILAVDEDRQILFFRNRDSAYTLSFSPRRGTTEFSGPTGGEAFDALVRPVVIIDGKVASLGGGRLDDSGTPRLSSGEDVPSLLFGVRLTIVSTGPATISSHLIRQGVEWRPGLPYVRESNTELVIFAGGILIGEEAPSRLVLQAQLVSSGAGFSVLGRNRDIHLLGSLQASGISLAGGRLTVDHDPGARADGASVPGPLGTTAPVLVVTSFKPESWSRDENE